MDDWVDSLMFNQASEVGERMMEKEIDSPVAELARANARALNMNIAMTLAENPFIRSQIDKQLKIDEKNARLMRNFPVEVQKVWKKGKVYKDPFTNEIVWLYKYDASSEKKKSFGNTKKIRSS